MPTEEELIRMQERQKNMAKSLGNVEDTIYGADSNPGMKTVLDRVNTKINTILWCVPILFMVIEFLMPFIRSLPNQ